MQDPLVADAFALARSKLMDDGALKHAQTPEQESFLRTAITVFLKLLFGGYYFPTHHKRGTTVEQSCGERALGCAIVQIYNRYVRAPSRI